MSEPDICFARLAAELQSPAARSDRPGDGAKIGAAGALRINRIECWFTIWLEHRQRQAAPASDRERRGSLLDACRFEFDPGGDRAIFDSLRRKGKNPLDRGEGEMF